MKKTLLVSLVSAFVGFSHAGSGKTVATGKEALPPPPPAAKPPSRSHFRLSGGVSYRSLGKTTFRTGSESSFSRLPFLAAQQAQGNSVGSPNGLADRNYHDGFVYRDDGTASNGDTWFWGYDSASQVNGDALKFQGIGGSAASSDQGSQRDPLAPWGDDLSGAAPVVQLDWLYDLKPNLSVGLSLQWTFLSQDGSNQTSNFSAFQSNSQQTIHVTDHYDLQGVLPPTAPYAGTHGGPGPLITNIPTSRSTHLGDAKGSSASYFNEIQESFDVDLHTLSLGPTLERRFNKLTLAASAGLGLNILNYDAEHQETLYRTAGGRTQAMADWNYKESGTDVLLGAYLQANVGYQFSPRWSLTAYARYDWSEEFSTKVGPSTFSVDPSGWSAGVMVGVGF